ncbi:serine/threonine-protein kinase [Persicimonas caeni]|nr:serine/threonine-protein kinase [Persicimonas caeni]
MEELQGKTLCGRFRLDKRLGQGGYGAVFEATQLSVGRKCAVKVLFPHLCEDEATVTRFRTEAKTTSRLTHPNSVILYDFGRDEELGLLFLAMELLDGTDLRSLIREQGTLGVERTVHIIEQAAQSLQEAHAIGLVHRDIKPHNIMIIERGGDSSFVKVIDFGIAKVVRAGILTVSEMTRTGTVIGTPKYMAPEQIRDRGIDGRTDMYGLAISAYQMLTGRTPFEEGTAMEIAGRQIAERPEPVRNFHPGLPIGDEFEQVLLKALAKDPNDRFDSVAEFAEALARTARLPVSSSPSALGRQPDASGESPAVDGVIDDYVELTQAPDADLYESPLDEVAAHAPVEPGNQAEPGNEAVQAEGITSTSLEFDDDPAEKTMATMAVPNPARPELDAHGNGTTAELAKKRGETTEEAVPESASSKGREVSRQLSPVWWAAVAAVLVLSGLGVWVLVSHEGAAGSAPARSVETSAESTLVSTSPARPLEAEQAAAQEMEETEEAAPAEADNAQPQPSEAAKAEVGESAPVDDEGGEKAPAKPDNPADLPHDSQADKPAPADEPAAKEEVEVPDTKPSYGSVEVRVIPWGTLYVDGRKIGGGTRHTLRLRTGRRRLVLKQSGEVRARRTVDVSARSSKIIELVAK